MVRPSFRPTLQRRHHAQQSVVTLTKKLACIPGLRHRHELLQIGIAKPHIPFCSCRCCAAKQLCIRLMLAINFLAMTWE